MLINYELSSLFIHNILISKSIVINTNDVNRFKKKYIQELLYNYVTLVIALTLLVKKTFDKSYIQTEITA
jgi:hypothetical protein